MLARLARLLTAPLGKLRLLVALHPAVLAVCHRPPSGRPGPAP